MAKKISRDDYIIYLTAKAVNVAFWSVSLLLVLLAIGGYLLGRVTNLTILLLILAIELGLVALLEFVVSRENAKDTFVYDEQKISGSAYAIAKKTTAILLWPPIIITIVLWLAYLIINFQSVPLLFLSLIAAVQEIITALTYVIAAMYFSNKVQA